MFDATSRACRSTKKFPTSGHSRCHDSRISTNADDSAAIDWLSIINIPFKVSASHQLCLLAGVFFSRLFPALFSINFRCPRDFHLQEAQSSVNHIIRQSLHNKLIQRDLNTKRRD